MPHLEHKSMEDRELDGKADTMFLDIVAIVLINMNVRLLHDADS